eukprot:CAMPEP_0181140008 /NCGR_PEP_ID=MMETSP1071-20121207/35083_1 /TAXON_ID=35127 /ORGANISM="Thalassiosira sp., Strain NH16" /LENGTH=1022 /DNA_ID=CAMNT_0023226947 /DNA_START=76 /DNA_END=3144 /DNA_ORIENTATION=+
MAKKKTNARHIKKKSNSAKDEDCVQRTQSSLSGVGIVALLAIALFYNGTSSKNNSRMSTTKTRQSSNSKDAFLEWFVENGGTFHPIYWGNDRAVNVTIEAFPSYGGWGLALPLLQESSQPPEECRVENTDGIPDSEKKPIIKHLDPLFTVPSSIIISVQSILEIYATDTSSPLYLPDFYFNVNKILTQAFPNSRGLAKQGMGLVQQDVIIAIYLMVENCHHDYTHLFSNNKGSRWGPYLDVLPNYTLPRLDTFGDEEYSALNDDNLEYTGRNSKRLLGQIFFDDGAAVANGSLKSVVQDMIRQKISHGRAIPASCISFDTFHIVSSRSMVLKGVKYLTPLAGMINYAPKVEAHQQDDDHSDLTRAPFDLYHTLSKDNSIIVRSDRDIFYPKRLNDGAMIQIFEDYGPVDSSLFLEAHGFAPHENPNNCASISGSFFLRRIIATGRYDENADLVLRALKNLHLIHPKVMEFEALENVCVKQNLEVVDDGLHVGVKPASDSIALASLLLGDSDIMIESFESESFFALRDKCIAAIRSGDTERMEIRCARYPGSGRIVRQALRTAAGRAIANFEDEGDTEEKLLVQFKQAELQDRDRLVLALRFRLEERKILTLISSQDELDPSLDSVKNKSMSLENLDKKLIAFASFVESLALPLNKIEPKVVGNGMRFGAFATTDIELDSPYISLPANLAIDVSTAQADLDETSDLAALLRKYSDMNNPQHNDGFDVLVLFLLHERFILREQSRWWPYLDLLPSVDELSAYHPIFFQEKEIDRYLAGSDVRRLILRYQQRATERHTALSSDLDANLVLGSNIILDKRKFFWATAILDSRSIWWKGKRHLAPLLDLVNADVSGRAHKTGIEDSDDMTWKAAVTRASRHVQKGEQVFENYAQPNYLLFTYHGFILDNNPNDCALLDGLSINRNDPGAKFAHQFQSTAPTFCIRDLSSVKELQEFLAVKHGVDDARSYLVQVLEERVARLTEAMDTDIHTDRTTLPRVRFMRQIVKNDLTHLLHALNVESSIPHSE